MQRANYQHGRIELQYGALATTITGHVTGGTAQGSLCTGVWTRCRLYESLLSNRGKNPNVANDFRNCEIRYGANLFHFFSTQTDAFPTLLEDDNNTLDYYGVSDGAEILMEETDATEKDREFKSSVEERDRKIAEQEREFCAMQELQRQSNGTVRTADILGK